MVTLYNVTSKDGYIAREDGNEDFIPNELWGDFLALCKQHDVMAMGRKAYEGIIGEYAPELREAFEKLSIKKVVVTRDANYTVLPGYMVAHSPREACAMGENVLFSSGPILNTATLQAGLVDQVIVNILPENIGTGMKAFETEPALTLVSEEEREGGRLWRVYRINKES